MNNFINVIINLKYKLNQMIIVLFLKNYIDLFTNYKIIKNILLNIQKT
jgi:hypothetical protein